MSNLNSLTKVELVQNSTDQSENGKYKETEINYTLTPFFRRVQNFAP